MAVAHYRRPSGDEVPTAMIRSSIFPKRGYYFGGVLFVNLPFFAFTPTIRGARLPLRMLVSRLEAPVHGTSGGEFR